MNYRIRKPIFYSRSVGLNEAQLDETNTIKILYKNKQKQRLYPKAYTITKQEVLQYPIMQIKSARLRIIPIYNLREKIKGRSPRRPNISHLENNGTNGSDKTTYNHSAQLA